jgi:hypothetical protein
MTMPNERTRAVMQTREFLRDLATGNWPTELPLSVQREARRLLRHYPRTHDMQLAHLALPTWYGPTQQLED